MSVKCLCLIAALIGLACAQTEVSSFPENFTLPPELKGKVDEKELKILQGKYTEQFKKKCEQNGGDHAYEKAQTSFSDLSQCLLGLVDPATLQKEIEDAKPNGSVDEVFKKYCQKKPSFKLCFNNLFEAAKPCFTTEEKKNLKTVSNVTEQLAEFICHKEGDRIALFIAEGGQECFQEKQQDLERCMNSTLGGNVNLNVHNFTGDNIPTLSFDEKQCKKLTELQTCVVGELETCSKPTSANIVESLFKYIRKSTPCKAFEDPNEKITKPNSAGESAFTASVITMGLAVALYV